MIKHRNAFEFNKMKFFTPISEYIRHFLCVAIIITVGVRIRYKSHFVHFISVNRKTTNIKYETKIQFRLNLPLKKITDYRFGMLEKTKTVHMGR